jgi:hypothetical protein
LVGYEGILQADAYDGYNRLYLADRKPGPVREAACWSHARRPFFVSLIAGILILSMPRLLNYIVATFLIVSGGCGTVK